MITKIGIIGYGNMGSAIGERLKKKYKISVFEKDIGKTKNIKGILVFDNIQNLVSASDAVLLAVKPQDFDEVLGQIKSFISDKLIISIAAGITTKYIEKHLKQVRVIRVMPNIGAKIGKSVSCLCKGKFTTDKDTNFAVELFNNIGVTKKLDERLMNAATAISGSGPAYEYYDMEKNKIDFIKMSKTDKEKLKKKYAKDLGEAAQEVGFDKSIATSLASSTTSSTIALAVVLKVPPSELRKQVTSKGGTTEAAIEVLSKGGSWPSAARAALKRAKELCK